MDFRDPWTKISYFDELKLTNYAKNNNQVEELFTDANGNELETIVLHSRRGLSLEARVGQPYGTLVGSAYQRVPDGEFAGQVIFKDGVAQKESALQVIGNVTPDWTGGILNNFSFKGLHSFLGDQ